MQVHPYDLHQSQQGAEIQAEELDQHSEKEYHYDYDYYDVHQFQSCQDDEAESVHAQWSDHVLVWREDPYILLLGKNWPRLKG